MIETRDSYPPAIDFDESHQAWIRNKRKLPNGMYRYICSGIFRNGNPCNRAPMPFRSACRIHEGGDETSAAQVSRTDAGAKNERRWTSYPWNATSGACSGSPKLIAEPDTHEETKPNNVDVPPIRKFANAFLKSRKTAPIQSTTCADRRIPRGNVSSSPANESDEIFRVPTIDVRAESICIYTTPPIYGTFTQIRNAVQLYRSIDLVDTPEKIRSKRRDVSVVIYNLQIMLSFLEGLEDMSKMETKQDNVVDVKTDILTFFGYDVETHINATQRQWTKTSADIRSEIITIMGVLFAAKSERNRAK